MTSQSEGIFYLEGIHSPPSPPGRTLSPVTVGVGGGRAASPQQGVEDGEWQQQQQVQAEKRSDTPESPLESSRSVVELGGTNESLILGPPVSIGPSSGSTKYNAVGGKPDQGLPTSTSSASSSSPSSSSSTLGISGLPALSGLRKSINQPNASSPLARWQVQPHSDDSDGASPPGSPERMSDLDGGVAGEGEGEDDGDGRRERSCSTSTVGEGTSSTAGMGWKEGAAGGGMSSPVLGSSLTMTPGTHLFLQRKARSGSASSVKNLDSSGGTTSASGSSSPRGSPRTSPKRSPVMLDSNASREGTAMGSSKQRTRSDSINSVSSQYEGGRGRSDSGGSVGREGMMTGSMISRSERGSGFMSDSMTERRRRVGEERERGETMPGTVLGLGVKTSPRMRRRSELPPDHRRMSISRTGLSSPLAMPARVSDAVSTISPLNPLPSPWAASPGPEFSTSPRTTGMTNSIDSSVSSASGSIRLTRVPTSVRMAQDLLKSTPAASSPEAMTGFNTPSIDLNDLADFPVDFLGGPIPATPSATRNVTPDETSTTIQEEAEPEPPTRDPALPRKTSNSDEAHPPSPTRLKRNAPRQRPSLPPPSAFVMPTSASNPAVQAKRSPEIRSSVPAQAVAGFPFREPIGSSTSMTFLSPGLRVGHHARNRSTSNETAPKPSIKTRMLSVGGMQVQNFAQDPRDMTVDPTTGLNSGNLSSSQDAEGDASRHANVIMQSRRAKIQRWRPGSSGTEGGSSTETPPVKPAFGRGVTSTGLGLRAHVDARPFRRVLSGQEHSEPAVFPLEEDTAGPADAPTFRDSFPNRSDRPIMNSRQDSQGSENVTGEPVHEIEWVDWMDEYKRYKEAKIRAEQAEQQVEIERTAGDLLIAPAHRTESPDQASGPVERERERQGSADAAIPSTSTNEDAASRPSYSPRKSEDNRPNPVSRLQLSRTISLSYGGNKGTASSSNDQKASLFKNDFGMVSRQPSLHSTRSSVFPGRKKKNIAAKMEGWWSAVKSNFSNPQHHSQQDMPDRYGSESPVRRTPTPRKLPSAPSSRRGSAVPVDNPSLPARQKTSRETDDISDHHLLRTATSHTNLQQLEVDHEQSIMSAAPANPSEKAQVPDSGTSTVTTLTPGMVIRPLPVSRLSSDVQNTFKPSTPSSLEARRRQPPLSLKLENNVLAPPRLHGRQNSNMSSGASTSNSSGRPGNHSHSRQESHASSGVYSTGVNTPGFHHWDQTPSPLMSLNATRPEQSDPVPDPNNGVPNLGNNDFTLASVRRHVRHRLTVAKEGCDRELRFIVSDITAFVEEHLHLPPAVADSDFDPEEVLQDSRTTFALSPRTAYSDLEDETDIMDRELGMHSQVAAMMIPQSAHARRSSISLSAATSPIKRREIASLVIPRDDPASPGRRRRSSAMSNPKNPRSVELGQRLGRVLSATLDRSNHSSRSNSRSRSPMPGTGLLSASLVNAVEETTNTKLVDALQKIIGIATDVTETDVDVLIAKPSTCRDFIERVRDIGQIWDSDPEAEGRSWYIRLLLAVAGLTRVVEWWEAEKGFWNFDGEEDNAPLTFVLKPAREGEPSGTPPTLTHRLTSEAGSGIGTPVTSSSLSDHPGQIPELQLEPFSQYQDEQATARPLDPTVDMPSQLQATQDLQLQAEHNKSINIVLELSLGGELIEWVNPAWHEITGSDPADAENTPITAWLAPADVDVLSDAGRQLEADDSHTAQARFRLLRLMRADDEDVSRQPGPTYIECEGIGMLMRNRDTGEASHTMWVIKPVISSQTMDTPSDIDVPSSALERDGDMLFPTLASVSSTGVLCRICERQVPTWFFEKHNETCNEVHRLEADISLANEKITDMSSVVSEIMKSLEQSFPDQPAAYQGLTISTRAKSTPQHAMGPVMLAVRRIQQSQLESAHMALDSAKKISTPSVKDEDSTMSISYQQLLSPASEDRLTFIGRWVKPETEDHALQLLFLHVDELIRQKQMTVNRMRNTIMYAERVRREWEDKMDRMLSIAEEDSTSERSSTGDTPETAEATHETALSISPVSAKRRAIDPKARLPPTTTTLQRQQSTYDASAQDESKTVAATQERTPAPAPSPPIIVPSKRLSVTRRISANRNLIEPPMSPRLPSVASMARTAPTSIKDFDIIKPISRGAFGSVYLAKKRTTGDYYAIKALKKSDMIAKNQITNVKAERTILMNQASSPYVAKLYFSFQNKDYLYLVMEYLNGGDCAALIKTLGGLPEEWARNYIAEVVLGLEYLHNRGIVHRDLKPDNLLIDSKGHLKLTDFGLSRIGLLNRQVGGPRPAVLRGTSLKKLRGLIRTSSPRHAALLGDTPLTTPDFLLPPTSSNLSQSYFSSRITDGGSADESSGSESFSGAYSRRHEQSRTTSARNSDAHKANDVPKFVGTPDYLCPESILGMGSDAPTVDWWAVGVVLYEFIYGQPPFHDETPEKVFDNIVSRRISWYEDQMELSPEARDLMERLMCMDPARRLGAHGAQEIKAHPFFAGIDWDTIATVEANFVPNVTDPESTDYFDARGAVSAVFFEDEAEPSNEVHSRAEEVADKKESGGLAKPIELDSGLQGTDDFGTFTFKNLPVLKQANDDVIKKLRRESILASEQGGMNPRDRRLSSAANRKTAKIRAASVAEFCLPPSPTASTSSSVSRTSALPQTPSWGANGQTRRVSDQHPLNKVQIAAEMDQDDRASSTDSGASFSYTSPAPIGKTRAMSGQSLFSDVDQRRPSDLTGRAVDVLIAEDNPISQKILETLLTRMGCRCVCVNDGAEALAASMGTIRFDIIITDLVMPNVTGEEVARMIRSTTNPNFDTPIIAATSYEHKQLAAVTAQNTADPAGSGSLFSAVLAKPITKSDLTDCMCQLGFRLGTVRNAAGKSTKRFEGPAVRLGHLVAAR